MENSRRILQTVFCVTSFLAVIGGVEAQDSLAAHGQPWLPQWQLNAGGRREFEVASVRPSPPGTPYGSTVNLADSRDGAQEGNFFKADAISMAYLTFAFKISDSSQALGIWSKLPDWGRTQFYHIEARAQGSPTRDQLRLMVQAVLSDRFKLVTHWELQTRREYGLVMDKPNSPGAQIRPHPADKPCREDPNRPTMISPAAAADVDAPPYCGLSTWFDEGKQHIRVIDGSMAQIANYLAGTGVSLARGSLTARSGVDHTGLIGRYDLDLQFIPESDSAGRPLDLAGPRFAEALKRQLGFRLLEAKGEAETLVIDRIEKPGPN